MTCPEADEQIKADLEEQVGVAGREALIYGLIFVIAAMFLYFSALQVALFGERIGGKSC